MAPKDLHLMSEAMNGDGIDFRRDASSAQADIVLNKATQLAKEGKRKEAINLFRQALCFRPGQAKAHHNLGVALSEEKEYALALASIRDAIRIQPNYAEAYYNLGNTLGEVGRTEEAVVAFKTAIRIRPDYVDAFNNLGLALCRLGRTAEAIVFHRQAVRLRPKSSEGHNNLGLAYAAEGEFAKAEACYEQALRLNPCFTDAHTNLGSAFKEQGQLDEALACYDMALAYEPNSVTTHWNRSLAWLQLGNYEQGWPEYEWRWKRKDAKPRTFSQPRWDGSPLQGGSILLHAEQGIGDTIQFLRYATLVKERGGKVTVAVPPCLVSLISRCPGVDTVVAENQELPPCDFHAPLMSLPGIFAITVGTVPAHVPYVQAEQELIGKWRERLRDVDGLFGNLFSKTWQRILTVSFLTGS
jgi:tetratricopeptide (TPR) repeat protein